MSTSEKITVNINVVDLGNIDLLVDQGFYSNRTDFIKTAIRNQLSNHVNHINEVVVKKHMVVGINAYTKRGLLMEQKRNNKIDIRVVGMLIFDDDISAELAKDTINSIHVLGTVRMKPELKEAINELFI